MQSSSCSGKCSLPVMLIVDLSLARVVQHSPFQFYAFVTPRSVPIPKSHWLAGSLASASGRRTPDGPPPVTIAPCLRSLTVVVGIKQGEILGRTEQYTHAHTIYIVHDVIQEVVSCIMFPVRYISPPLSSGRPRPGFFTRQ